MIKLIAIITLSVYCQYLWAEAPIDHYPDIHIKDGQAGLTKQGQTFVGFVSNQHDSHFYFEGQKVELVKGSRVYFYSNYYLKHIVASNNILVRLNGNDLVLTSNIEFSEQQKILSGHLTQKTPIKLKGQKVYIKNEISLHGNGNWKSLFFPVDMPIGLKYNTIRIFGTLRFYPDSTVETLYPVQDVKITTASGPILVRANKLTSFHKNGELSAATAADDSNIFVIDNQEVQVAQDQPFRLFPDGSLAEAYTTSPFVGSFIHNNVKSQLGTSQYPYKLSLNSQGQILSGHLAQEQELLIHANQYLKLKEQVTFFSHIQALESARIAEPYLFHANGWPHYAPVDTFIGFNNDGHLRSINLPSPILFRIGDKDFSIESYNMFYQGQLTFAYLTEPTAFKVQNKNIWFAKSSIGFHVSGAVNYGSLNTDTVLQFVDGSQKLVKQGQFCSFRELDGLVEDECY